jgi:hypothetical protein
MACASTCFMIPRQTLKFLVVVSPASFSSLRLHFVLALADTHFTAHDLLPSTTFLVLALARASSVYHIEVPSGASTSFGRLPPLLLAPTRGSAIYDLPLLPPPTRALAVYTLLLALARASAVYHRCFLCPQELRPSTTYLVMKVHLEPLRAKFWCIPSTCLYQEKLRPSTTASGASTSFCCLPHCFWRPQELRPSTTTASRAHKSFCRL